MRPVVRGPNPTGTTHDPYNDARPYLKDCIGSYCSYCERRIRHALEVEHLKPKDLYDGLKGEWDNFLLACKNCNATKGAEDVDFERLFFPDRDNTFAAFRYTKDGYVEPAGHLNGTQCQIANDTLRLTGLNKKIRRTQDVETREVTIDRIDDRNQARLEARRALNRHQKNPTPELKASAVDLARQTGFFSIWMDVFADHPDMQRRFIDAFPGTAADCFDLDADPIPVSPRPSERVAHLDGHSKI